MALKAAQPHPARARRESIDADARTVHLLLRAIVAQRGSSVSSEPLPTAAQVREVLYAADHIRTARAQHDPTSPPPTYHRPSGHSQRLGPGGLAGLDNDVRGLRRDAPWR